jgi:hypothetical protein
VVIVTEWQEFAEIDFSKLKVAMRSPIVIDLRNFLNEEQVRRSGFSYFGIGGSRRQAFDKGARRLSPTRRFWADTRNLTGGEDLLMQGIAAAE